VTCQPCRGSPEITDGTWTPAGQRLTVLEDWDPAIADGLAKGRPVIIFDNRGVGASEGKTPDTVADMAKDAMAFIDALGFTNGRWSRFAADVLIV
jgi:pimeloyl-ACP methyl ester carboxylesterase